jgi:aldehyde dehydrogenase (NAD+)
MKDEIFGPLLPIIEYSSDADIYTVISKYENHCLYTFSRKIKFEKIIQNYSLRRL